MNKQEKSLNEKSNQKLDEKEKYIRDLEGKLKQVELQLKQKETDNFKKVSEFEKLNALIEQKLHLTENEL